MTSKGMALAYCANLGWHLTAAPDMTLLADYHLDPPEVVA